MFSPMFSVLLVPFLAAMFLAINMGASGTAPSFSAAYGADLIRRERIPGVFGLCVLAGAILAGKKVAMTISHGILPEDVMGSRVLETTGREIVQFGPLGGTLVALVTATLLLLASASRGIPTSLVQMNTAAIMALGVAEGGWRSVASRTSVHRLFVVWIVAPLVSLALSFGLTAAAETLGLMNP